MPSTKVVSKTGGATATLVRSSGPPPKYKRQIVTVAEEPLSPSVVIPFHNRDEMVFECVESVMFGAPIGCEVIVVDDGSDDPTVIVRLQKAYPSLVCLRLPENSGVAVARNRGNSVASGNVIIDLDSDDLLLDGAIQMVIEEVENGADYLYGDIIRRREDGEEVVTRPEWEANLLLQRGCFVTGLKAYRKVLWQRVGGFDETIRSAVDLDFALRCEEAGAVFKRVPEPLVVYREHEGQISQKDRAGQKENAKQVLSSARRRRSLV